MFYILKYFLFLLVLVFVAVLVLPASMLSQADDVQNTIADHLPSNTTGPVGNVDGSYKFDDGFYNKIQEMIHTEPQNGAPNVYDGKMYYDFIFVVPRDDGDQRHPDEVAAENKAALAKRLYDVGALDIRQGEILSFVTASVPVIELPGLSLHDEIFGIGDGALAVVADVDMARMTINATPEELTTRSGTVLNGSGVVVAVLDTGINHASLNDKIVKRAMCNDAGCNISSVANVKDDYVVPNVSPFAALTFDISHGTQVAQVLAASDLPQHNGIAPGVGLLDVHRGGTSTSVAHALDWSLKNGADVANMSFFLFDSSTSICAKDDSATHNRIINEAVDKGMVAVKSAGNRGDDGYNTITKPGCSHNVISVGGINDRITGVIKMYGASSRGPVTNDTPRLKPDLVAPADGIFVLTNFTGTNFHPLSGTSLAAPQVSATAAILLQAKPDLTPVEIKAAILLGADWQAPIPCNSPQFEKSTPSDNCSYIVQPRNSNTANNAASLGILNNVGFGILNVNQTLEYTSKRTPAHNHVMGDYLDVDTNRKQYTFNVADTSEPVKVILTWFAHPHGSITEQISSNKTADPADLGFTVQSPTGKIINADSKYQTNEFAVFYPSSTGKYIVTVTGSNLDKINKYVQNYALASTHSLTILPADFLNRAPIAQSNTVIIDPNDKESAIIRLTGTDQNDDPISFSVSRSPLHGTVSTDEQITKTSSRMFYNASSDFGTRDTFEITPQDGLVAGRPSTITILAENLPPNTKTDNQNSYETRDDEKFEIKGGSAHIKYSKTYAGPGYPVSVIHLKSANTEGTDAHIVTTSGYTYTVAIPPSGLRTLELASPLTIRTITLSADALDEEAAHNNEDAKSIHPRTRIFNSQQPQYEDVYMFVGYLSASCTSGAVSGAQSSAQSCPANAKYRTSSSVTLDIPDNTKTQSTTDTVLVPVNGTLKSVSVYVDITHTYIGDLKVALSAPSGKIITLHDKTGANVNDIKKTYDSTSALRSLLNSAVAGNWTLTVGDYAGGDIGVLNSWSVALEYEPAPPVLTTTVRNSTTVTDASVMVFSDDFESGTLAKWTESGEPDWTISTSSAHSAPTLPDRPRTNMVLHADNCDTSCTITTKNTIDLSGYTAATLSFWRFVDYGFDGDEYLKVDLHDGSTWKTAFHWSPNINRGDDNKWHNESYDMSPYVGKSSVGIRFVTQQSSASEDVQIDNVIVNATSGTKTTDQNTTRTITPPSTTTAAAHSIYVADTDDYEILVYSATGTYQGDIVTRKSGGLGKPFDVTFGPDKHMYVSDNTYLKIRKYNGVTGASLGQTSTNAEWASTNGVPNGMIWNDNALYVATLRGVEKISSSGSNLGYFGDASRNPSTTGAPALVSPYDVAFCPDGHMYVADRSLDKILYYDDSTGKYKGTISNTPQSTQPNMDEAAGLKCGTSIAGATGTVSLFQSGEDTGWINEINYSTKKLIRQYTTLIDEPYGMDSDAAGNLYIANKDDDNIIRISSTGATSTVFATGSMDDPRGVIVGPQYIAASSAATESEEFKPILQDNDGPEPILKNGTSVVSSRMMISVGLNMAFDVVATDPEGDSVTLDMIPYAIPSEAVSIIDHKNGTGKISINTSDMKSDTYAFMITAHDDGYNLERAIYTVIVP